MSSSTQKQSANDTPISRYKETMRSFVQVSRMHHAEVERRVSSLHIHHSQHRMLMHLSHCGDNISQRELADALGISPAAVTVTLKCLEREGYVTRAMTEQDNRRNRVSITDIGRRKVEESCVIFDSVDSAVFAGFSGAEVDTLCALLARMYDNLSAMGDTAAPLPADSDQT